MGGVGRRKESRDNSVFIGGRMESERSKSKYIIKCILRKVLCVDLSMIHILDILGNDR